MTRIASPIDEKLKSTRLLITAGSGGVGKTTVAASVGLRAALQGRRVAVVTIDPARRLAQALGLEALTGRMSSIDLGQFPGAGGTLGAMMLDVKTTSDHMVRRFSKTAEEAQRILENRYYIQFSSAISGSQEYMAIEQVRLLMEESEYDLVVLDTPPAVHALDFLDAPARLIRGLKRLPLGTERHDNRGLASRLAAQGRNMVLKGLNRLTGGPFIEETAEFLRVFSSILTALEEAAVRVEKLLKATSTAFFVVATPRVDPLRDALLFREALVERALPFSGFIVNRVHEAQGLGDIDHHEIEQRLLAAHPSLARDERLEMLVSTIGQSVHAHERRARFDGQRMACLNGVGSGSVITIPRLAGDVHTLTGLARLATTMAIRTMEP
ncbi:MAG: ArsA-related P-loop ATPase [Myxococcota bacterium]|nr:ArsA-related P-loop ATPase [Myxococcota bacterium]